MKHTLANRIGFFWRMFWTYRFLKRGTRVLNVGQRPGERKIYEWGWYIIAKRKNYSHFEIFEAWDKNVVELQKENKVTVIAGDVREIDKIYKANSLDAILWFEGPEHIEKSEIKPTIEKLKTIATQIILSCPCGEYSQDTLDGNPYEYHKAVIFPNNLMCLGFKTQTLNMGIHKYLFGYWNRERAPKCKSRE